MVKKHSRYIIMLLIVTLVFITGCQSPISLVQPTATTVPSDTPIPPTNTPTETATPTSTPTPTPTPTVTPTQTPTPIIYGPSNYPTDVNPLTGLKVADPKILDRRPVMVKVANFPSNGRPHAGLSAADIVFEYYIGEGTNRFLALYYGQDAPKIGPVRSARLVDGQLVNQYQGILGFVSADLRAVLPVIYNELGNRAITSWPSTCPALCDDGGNSVISIFADSAKLTQYAATKLAITKTRYDLEGMYFNSQSPDTGLKADKITVTYNPQDVGDWRYDKITGNYLRWIENVDNNNKVTMVPLVDRNTGKQLAFSNVVISFAKYTQYAPTLHDINMWNNTKGQRAVLFRDGKAVDGIWKSNGKFSPIQFFTSDGKPMPFKPGNSWMVITGENTELKQSVLGQWEMQFHLP